MTPGDSCKRDGGLLYFGGQAALTAAYGVLGTGAVGGKSGGSKTQNGSTATISDSEALSNATYAQKTFNQTFSADGAFAGRTVSDVANSLKTGQLSPANVPIEYIIRGGNVLILNTRSAQALEQAGIPRSKWNAVNMTGNTAAELRLTSQLRRNYLSNEDVSTVRPGGGK